MAYNFNDDVELYTCALLADRTDRSWCFYDESETKTTKK